MFVFFQVCYPRGVSTACPQPNKPGVCPPNTSRSRPTKHDDQSRPSAGASSSTPAILSTDDARARAPRTDRPAAAPGIASTGGPVAPEDVPRARRRKQHTSSSGAPRPPLPVLPRFRSDPEDYKLLFVDHAMFANLTGQFKDESSLSGEDRALLLSGSFLLR